MFNTSKDGEVLVISLREPYRNLTEIYSYTDTVVGETDTLYYKREFAYSTDGVLYNDYRPLTDSRLQQVPLDPANEFWIKYRYTQVGDGELTFESVTLEGTTEDGLTQAAPMCGDSSSAEACCGVENLVYECEGCDDKLFNPYSVGNAESLYNQLSNLTSSMFGICVLYFKTQADQRSRDVVLREYSLENVIAQDNVKILVPQNQLPTREINFNPLMLNFTSVFEVHIVKNGFRKAFGRDARPEVHDYLFFEQYLNRMFEVNAVSEPDDFMFEGSYWRVSLTPYQQRAAVRTEPETLKIDGSDLVFSSDKFNAETESEGADANHHDGTGTPLTQTDRWLSDRTRRILDKKLVIRHAPLNCGWVVVSKDYYCLDSIRDGEVAVQYRYDGGAEDTEERLITFWANLQDTPAPHKYDISQIYSIDGRVALELDTEVRGIRAGDYVSVRGVQGLSRLQKVVMAESTTLVLCDAWQEGMTLQSPARVQDAGFRYVLGNGGLRVLMSPEGLIMEIGGQGCYYRSEETLQGGRWYAVALNLNFAQGKSGAWIYTPGDNKGDSLRAVSQSNSPLPAETLPTGYWGLKGSPLWLTNVRVFKEMCPEEHIKTLLMQYRVKDNHLALLVDNASPELLMDTVTNPR